MWRLPRPRIAAGSTCSSERPQDDCSSGAGPARSGSALRPDGASRRASRRPRACAGRRWVCSSDRTSACSPAALRFFRAALTQVDGGRHARSAGHGERRLVAGSGARKAAHAPDVVSSRRGAGATTRSGSWRHLRSWRVARLLLGRSVVRVGRLGVVRHNGLINAWRCPFVHRVLLRRPDGWRSRRPDGLLMCAPRHAKTAEQDRQRGRHPQRLSRKTGHARKPGPDGCVGLCADRERITSASPSSSSRLITPSPS